MRRGAEANEEDGADLLRGLEGSLCASGELSGDDGAGGGGGGPGDRIEHARPCGGGGVGGGRGVAVLMKVVGIGGGGARHQCLKESSGEQRWVVNNDVRKDDLAHEGKANTAQHLETVARKERSGPRRLLGESSDKNDEADNRQTAEEASGDEGIRRGLARGNDSKGDEKLQRCGPREPNDRLRQRGGDVARGDGHEEAVVRRHLPSNYSVDNNAAASVEDKGNDGAGVADGDAHLGHVCDDNNGHDEHRNNSRLAVRR